MNKINGSTLAAAAALILASGLPLAATAADSAKVHCAGVNACKGTSECSTAKNSCAGQNACKGQGWISLTREECAQAQARVKEEKPDTGVKSDRP
ncbi:MAG: hypothetical protein JSR95_01580 [Proteobacteria bacterium]|nr:hypothetical protein [Pseudomonadota bacterium]